MPDEPPPQTLLTRLIDRIGDFLILCIRFGKKHFPKSVPAPGNPAKTPVAPVEGQPENGEPPKEVEDNPNGKWAKIKRYHQTTPVWRLRLFYYSGFLVVFAVLVLWCWLTWPRVSQKTGTEEERRVVIELLVRETSEAISREDPDRAGRLLKELEGLIPDHAIFFTLSGAQKTLLKDFDGAREEYLRVIRKQPTSFVALFNLAELDFVAGNYQAARDLFQKLHDARPKDENVIFRLFLCSLFLGDTAAADRWFQSLPPATLSPANHYARAARLFHANQKSEGRKILETARLLFPDKIKYYEVTFSSLNYR